MADNSSYVQYEGKTRNKNTRGGPTNTLMLKQATESTTSHVTIQAEQNGSKNIKIFFEVSILKQRLFIVKDSFKIDSRRNPYTLSVTKVQD